MLTGAGTPRSASAAEKLFSRAAMGNIVSRYRQYPTPSSVLARSSPLSDAESVASAIAGRDAGPTPAAPGPPAAYGRAWR